MDKSQLGLVQVFYGDGKGKTTSALGTALRACGNECKVHLIQFMKNGASSLEQQIPGEIKSLQKFSNFSWERFGAGSWIVGTPEKEHIDKVNEAVEHLENSLNQDFDIIIADEILYAVQLGLLSEKKILEIIEKAKQNKKELILTGSHKPFQEIFEKADLVTEIKKIKHPYDKGIQARKGIEY